MAKRKPKKLARRGIAPDLLKRAQKFSESGPKQHHIVPASYLERWTENGVLRMTDLTEQVAVVVSPRKAAKQSQFYSLESEQIDPEEIPPLLIEMILSEEEGRVKPLLDRLITNPQAVGMEDVIHISRFLGYQVVRGARSRAMMRASFSKLSQLMTPRNLSDDELATLLEQAEVPVTREEMEKTRALLSEIASGDVRMVPQDPTLTALSMEHAETVGYHLFRRRWIVYQTPSVLITSDEPVVCLDGPGGDPRGTGGVATSGIVVFPLNPTTLLVMVRPDIELAHPENGFVSSGELSSTEVVEVNRWVGLNAFRFCFERPAKSVALRLKIPSTREELGYEDVTDTVLVRGEAPAEGSMIFRHFTPNRLHGRSEVPPWPVSWWWSDAMLTPHEYLLANEEEMKVGRDRW